MFAKNTQTTNNNLGKRDRGNSQTSQTTEQSQKVNRARHGPPQVTKWPQTPQTPSSNTNRPCHRLTNSYHKLNRSSRPLPHAPVHDSTRSLLLVDVALILISPFLTRWP